MKAPARLVATLTTAAVLVIGLAAPALADAPTTWDEGPRRSTLENLVFFGGGTLAMIAIVTVFALLVSRHNYVPPPPGSELEVSDEPAERVPDEQRG